MRMHLHRPDWYAAPAQQGELTSFGGLSSIGAGMAGGMGNIGALSGGGMAGGMAGGMGGGSVGSAPGGLSLAQLQGLAAGGGGIPSKGVLHICGPTASRCLLDCPVYICLHVPGKARLCRSVQGYAEAAQVAAQVPVAYSCLCPIAP